MMHQLLLSVQQIILFYLSRKNNLFPVYKTIYHKKDYLNKSHLTFTLKITNIFSKILILQLLFWEVMPNNFLNFLKNKVLNKKTQPLSIKIEALQRMHLIELFISYKSKIKRNHKIVERLTVDIQFSIIRLIIRNYKWKQVKTR
jgi:hypothetical protein